MNEDQFQHSVNTLSAKELLLLKFSYSLCLVDDQTLSIEKGCESCGLEIKLSSIQLDDAESIRQFLCEKADSLIKRYYRTHPSTKSGFNRQVLLLIRQYGAESFAALPGKAAKKTLFVDDGAVVAEQLGARVIHMAPAVSLNQRV